MVQQVTAFVVHLVDVGSSLNQTTDFIVVPSNERVLKSEQAALVHLQNIGTLI